MQESERATPGEGAEETAAPHAPVVPEPRTAPAAEAPRGPRGIVRVLLRVPLFWKILIANAAIVIAGAIVGSLVTAAHVRAEPGSSAVELVGFLALGGVLLSVAVNALILHLALTPLQALERTAGRVQAGDVDARVPLSPLADRELDRLSRTFNAMLDSAAVYRHHLREVAARALSAAEEERKRIARELHDETAQMLAALLIRIRLVSRAGDGRAQAALLEEMRSEIGEALEGVRRFARGLRPPALDELGLVPAIESHVRALQESTGVQVQVEADDVDGLLSPQEELAVYRIVQEALSNVIRHAGATRAWVRIAREPGRLAATVRDDGHGFSPARVLADRAGLGLFGMQERAAYLGGRVEVQSEPGAGARVRVEVPVSDGPPAG